MAKRQGHGRKNQKPTDAWSMDGCRAFWRYKTNKEKNESRRIIVKASTKKKNKWPMSIWSWSVSSKMYSNMPGGEGEDPTLLGKWSNFFGCLVTHGLSSKKEATLRTTCWLFISSRFDHLATNLPLKENTFGFKKKEGKPAGVLFFYPCSMPFKTMKPWFWYSHWFFFLPILWSGIAWCPRSG